jgi:hypothetical protein
MYGRFGRNKVTKVLPALRFNALYTVLSVRN